MKLFQRVGAVLPGHRRSAPAAHPSEPASSSPGPASSAAEPALDAVGATFTQPSAADPAAASAQSVDPAEPSEIDILSLLPPELRQPSPTEPEPEPAASAPAQDPDTPPIGDEVAAFLATDPAEGQGTSLESAPLPSFESDDLPLLSFEHDDPPPPIKPDPAPEPAFSAGFDLGAMLAAEFRQPTRRPSEAERAARLPEPAKPPPQPPARKATGPDLAAATGIGGFLAACLADFETGLMLASEGGGRLDLEAVAAVSTEVLRAEMQVVEALELDDRIEDILVTTSDQFHILRPLERTPGVFLFVALDRRAANLGMARRQLAGIEAELGL